MNRTLSFVDAQVSIHVLCGCRAMNQSDVFEIRDTSVGAIPFKEGFVLAEVQSWENRGEKKG